MKCDDINHVWTKPDDAGENDLPPTWPYDQQPCECGKMPFPREKALAHPDGWNDEGDRTL